MRVAELGAFESALQDAVVVDLPVPCFVSAHGVVAVGFDAGVGEVCEGEDDESGCGNREVHYSEIADRSLRCEGVVVKHAFT